MKIPILGAHVSAAGGLPNAVANAKKIGARTIQIFGSSPRQFAVRMPAAESVAEYKKLLKETGISLVYLHAAYLLRLGSERAGLRGISIKNLAGHLKIAEMTSARGLIFHLGSQGDGDKAEALNKTVSGMRAVLKIVPGKTLLIMENSSGGGTKLGSGIDDLALLKKRVKSDRVKLCFDTAHAFEAGTLKYDDRAAIKKPPLLPARTGTKISARVRSASPASRTSQKKNAFTTNHGSSKFPASLAKGRTKRTWTSCALALFDQIVYCQLEVF